MVRSLDGRCRSLWQCRRIAKLLTHALCWSVDRGHSTNNCTFCRSSGRVNVIDHIWRNNPADVPVLHHVHHSATRNCQLGVRQWLAVNCPMVVTPCSGSTLSLMMLAVSTRICLSVLRCLPLLSISCIKH
jgi:hypothetical protein